MNIGSIGLIGPVGIPSFADDACASAVALRDLFPPTPLQRNDHLSARYGAEIWLKREDLSPVRSYKIRGAFTAMRKERALHPAQGHFVCASAGNHAQGVAFACRHFGVKGTIFMPVTTPQQKIDKTRIFGGDAIEIVLVGDYFDLEPTEKRAMWKLVDDMREYLRATFKTTYFNIGVNCGEPAGQTIAHVHIHLIPRYAGDTPNPRGGVRGVIPGKQAY